MECRQIYFPYRCKMPHKRKTSQILLCLKYLEVEWQLEIMGFFR